MFIYWHCSGGHLAVSVKTAEGTSRWLDLVDTMGVGLTRACWEVSWPMESEAGEAKSKYNVIMVCSFDSKRSHRLECGVRTRNCCICIFFHATKATPEGCVIIPPLFSLYFLLFRWRRHVGMILQRRRHCIFAQEHYNVLTVPSYSTLEELKTFFYFHVSKRRNDHNLQFTNFSVRFCLPVWLMQCCVWINTI